MYYALVRMNQSGNQVLEYFLEHSKLSEIEKRVLRNMIRDGNMDLLSDQLARKTAENIAQLFSEYYIAVGNSMSEVVEVVVKNLGNLTQELFGDGD